MFPSKSQIKVTINHSSTNINRLNNSLISVISGYNFHSDLLSMREVCHSWQKINAIRCTIIMNNNGGDRELQQEIKDICSHNSIKNIVCGRKITDTGIKVIVVFVNLRSLDLSY